jgi:hypothetical protein
MIFAIFVLYNAYFALRNVHLFYLHVRRHESDNEMFLSYNFCKIIHINIHINFLEKINFLYNSYFYYKLFH